MALGPQRNTRPANLPIDPITGRVAVKNPAGKIVWLHAVDAREQLARGGVTLANEKEAPPTVVGKPAVNWAGVPLEKLREHAQNAGVNFIAKTRAQIEAGLAETGYVPLVEDAE